MKAASISNNKLVVNNVAPLELSLRFGAVVKVLGCGLCGSDIVKLREKISPEGTVLGHEIVAQIVEINSKSNFKVGDIIVTSHHIPCGNCLYCKSGNVSMCMHFKSTNIIPGGFSELVYLSEEHLLNVAHLKPKNLTNVEASFYEPLGCCVRAIKRAQLDNNSQTVVIGLGSIGNIMTQGLKAFGSEVVGLDLIDERVELMKSKGVDAINSSDIEKTYDYVKTKTDGYGVDAVFMTSGSDRAIDLALKIVRNGGKIIVFSSTPKNFGYANNEIYYRELTVMGSYSPSPDDLKKSLELLAENQVDVKNISTIYQLDEVQKAIEDTVENKIMKAYIEINKV